MLSFPGHLLRGRLGNFSLRFAGLLDGPEKRLELLGLALPGPVTELDRLILTKAQRRPYAIEDRRDEPSRIPTLGGFVLHPGRLDRSLGPQDQNCVRIRQRLVDLAGEVAAALDVAIPPDIVARLRDQPRQLLGEFGIVTRVAEKDACHQSPLEAPTTLLR